MKKTLMATAVACAVLVAPAANAAEETRAGQEGLEHTQAMEHGEAHQLHGVVNSVNGEAGRVNITHDPVESLKWPKMKMNFKARDRALLKDIKAGMTVDFEITKMGNEYYVTKLTPVK